MLFMIRLKIMKGIHFIYFCKFHNSRNRRTCENPEFIQSRGCHQIFFRNKTHIFYPFIIICTVVLVICSKRTFLPSYSLSKFSNLEFLIVKRDTFLTISVLKSCSSSASNSSILLNLSSKQSARDIAEFCIRETLIFLLANSLKISFWKVIF